MSLSAQLFLTFFGIGASTFGGGYAMIPFITQRVVENGWLTLSEVIDMIAIAEMTPGPFAVNIATFTGMKLAGIPGALLATLGMVLPSLIVIMIVYTVFRSISHNKTVQSAMRGIRPAVVGLISAAACSIGASTFFPAGLKAPNLISIALAAAALFGIVKVKLSPILCVLLCGAAGILIYGIL